MGTYILSTTYFEKESAQVHAGETAFKKFTFLFQDNLFINFKVLLSIL